MQSFRGAGLSGVYSIRFRAGSPRPDARDLLVVHANTGTEVGGVVLEVQDLVYRPGQSYPRHTHAYSSLFVVLGGHVRERSGPIAHDCAAGCVGFIPSGVEHQSQFGRCATRTLNLVFDESALQAFDMSAPMETRYAAGVTIASEAMRLSAAYRLQDPSGTLAVEEHALRLLDLACTNRHARQPEAPPAWLASVTDYINACFDQPLDLTAVSAAAGRHPAHVCRTFHAAFGCSITDYVMFVRMQHACGLLRASAASLVSVALQTGFYDQAHFTRIFRRIVGITPGAYRSSFT